MTDVKAENPQEQKYFDYLEELRQSGVTNMFGAAPYLQGAFDLAGEAARDILMRWQAHDGATLKQRHQDLVDQLLAAKAAEVPRGGT